MNTIEQITIRAPSGKDDVCAKITVDNTDTPFVLYDTTVEEQQYTLGFYAKSDAPGEMTVGDTTFATGTEWQRYVVLFVAEEEDTAIYFNSPGTYYFYHIKLETGNKDTDWSPNPEDIEETAYNLEERLKSAELKLTKDGIVGIVSGYYAVNTEVEENFKKISTTVTQTAKDLTVKIDDAAKTATNFLQYSANGLVVGDLVADELGSNVQITTNAVKIRSGETVVAKYSGETISLLNGIGSIKAKLNPEYNQEDLYIYGKKGILLYSPGTATLYGGYGEYDARVDCIYGDGNPWVCISARDAEKSASGVISVRTDGMNLITGGLMEVGAAKIQALIDQEVYILTPELIINQGFLKVCNNGVTTTIGSYNNGWSHFQTGCNIPFYFDSPLHAVTKIQVYNSNTYLYNGGLAVGNTTYNDGFIELKGGTPFIDFHFNESGEGYTSRIIETSSGTLTCSGNWNVNGYSRSSLNFVCLSSGNGLYGTHTNGSTRMRVAVATTSSAGTDSDAVNCTIHGDGSYRTYLVGASIYHNKALNQYSDRRLKTDIEDVDERYIELFDNLSPALYHMKTNESRGKDIGYIAQDVLKAMKMSGINEEENTIINRTGNPDDDSLGEILTLNYNGLFIVTSYALQETRKRLKQLEEEIQQLKQLQTS